MKAKIRHTVEGLKDKVKKISQKLVHNDKKMKTVRKQRKLEDQSRSNI